MTKVSRNYGSFITQYKGYEIRETNGRRWGKYFAFSIERRSWDKITHFHDIPSLKKAIDEKIKNHHEYLREKTKREAKTDERT